MSRLRDAKGLGTKLRTATGTDSAAADHATTIAQAKQIVYGGESLLVKARHNNSAGTLTATLIYYDRDDVVLGFSDPLTLDAVSANLVDTNKYESALQVELAVGAHAVRIYVTALATSTSVDLYVGYVDPFTR